MQKHVKSFVAFCSFYRTSIHHFADCSAPLTDLCREIVTRASSTFGYYKAAFKTLKARKISSPVLLIPKSCQEAEFVVAKDAIKVGIAWVLFQEDFDGQLIACAYWAEKSRD